ncbi:hypothetical protein IAU60_002924 [Kwoniella sp. DSM 27419]
MHLSFVLLPLLAVASARQPMRPRVTRIPPTPVARELDDRGLLDGLVGGLGQTVSGLGGTLGGVVGGLGNTLGNTLGGDLGGAVGGLLGGVGQVVGGTVTTLGGVVEDVSKLNLEVLVNTCVRLGTVTHIDDNVSLLGGTVSTSGGVTLAAGACVCVDAATDVSLAGVDAKVGVYASGGLYFNGTAAANIASSTQPGLLGLSAGVYNFDVVETCLAAQITLSNSHHDLQPVGGSCCARACDSGYVLTGGSKCCRPGSTLDASGNCLTPPTCTTTEILCNNQCYPKASYTCPSGLPVQILSKRAAACPMGMSKCAVGALGAGQWECVDIQSDIESCGGCMYPSVSMDNTPQAIGTDCTAIPNIDIVSCIHGSCLIEACAKGFQLASNGTSCELPSKQIENRSIKARNLRLREIPIRAGSI